MKITVSVSHLKFTAILEEEAAPETCKAIKKMLPFTSKIIQARWSGEAAWVPMGDTPVGVGYENHTSYPAPGELLLYIGNLSETEILFPYGSCMFASKMGQLAGNHFATIEATRDRLREAGRLILWEGAQEFTMELAVESQ